MAVLKLWEAQRRIRAAAADRLNLCMAPEVPNQMRLAQIDLALLKIALRGCRVRATDGADENPSYQVTGDADGITITAEVRLFAHGDGSDVVEVRRVGRPS